MNFLINRKLATRIGMITSAITVAGLLLLWIIVSGRISSMVENNITNQMIEAVESRASIINDYVTSAEEYMTAFALSSEVRELLANPDDPSCCKRDRNILRILQRSKAFLRGCISERLPLMC